MKKILTLAVVLMTTIALFAQEKKDVTKFLGIPVDGYKSEMISKLKAKGFTESTKINGCLEGELNGHDVYLGVETNNNKVCRIIVMYKDSHNQTNIRMHFNNLLHQFENNSKYIGYNNEPISENENLVDEISVKNKRYNALFYQNGDRNKLVWFTIAHKNYNNYVIVIYYDNCYNQANGEDL